MRALHKHTALTVALLLALAGACVEDAPVDNDNGTDSRNGVGVGDGDDNTLGGTGDGDDDDNTVGGTGDRDGSAGNDNVSGDDGGASSAESVVAGTAIDASCAGNSKPASGMCGGYYCGTTKEAIRAETEAQSVCGGEAHLELLCSATISTTVTKCARTAGQMVLASDEEKVTYTRTCAKDEPALAEVTDACLECFVISATCARDNCVVECLPGDSASCDKCRIDNGCTPSVFPCAGIPNPL